jgi:predicted double-glycine peptidase
MRPGLFLVVALLLLGGCTTRVKSPPQFLSGAGPLDDFSVKLGSFQDRRFETVVRQRYDFSCGSAALATLLRYHYGYKVGEDLAFRGMWLRGNREQIRKLGFSLLDMKQWLASRGLTADGYKVPLDTIAKTGVPGIALISVKQYRHFVVVKGVRGGEVLLGDPSLGLVLMPRAKFEKAWNGVYFVLADERPLGRRSFNAARQWAAYGRAPTSGRFAEPISLQALALTAPFYGDF